MELSMHDAKSKLMQCIEYLIDADHLANPPPQTLLRKLLGKSAHADRDRKLSIARHLLGTTFVLNEPLSLQDFWRNFGPGNSAFGTGPLNHAQRDKILSYWISVLRPDVPDSQHLVDSTLQTIISRASESYRRGRENGVFVSVAPPRTLLIKELQNSLQLQNLKR